MTIAGVGTAIVSGAASAAGGIVASKVLGGKGNKMKGKGIPSVIKNVARKLGEKKSNIVKIIKNIKVGIDDVPIAIKKKAEMALDVITKNGTVQPDKTKILKVAKYLIPSIRKAFHKKVENKVKLPLSGGSLVKHFDDKVFQLLKKVFKYI